nr:endonuclease/exonuclease/phosphatase family protein [Marinisporobacter balticus]
MKKMIKIILLFGALGVFSFILFLAYMTITDYRPKEKEAIPLMIENNKDDWIKRNTPFSILTFNIGYCGLDKGQDFFKSGGKMSRSKSKEQTETNLKKIIQFLNKEKTSFICLQEVDIDASRSFHINQLKALKNALSMYSSTFALNYKVSWVPVPIADPMGSVYSGIVSMSKYKISESNRYQYPGKEKWPIQVFMLDRCFLESRIPVENGKELVLVNSHLSAYDKGGEIRKKQLAYLKEYITKEYNRGNYVIVGGDFNHVLPGTDPKLFKTTEKWPEWLFHLPNDFTPDGFMWVADKYVPTVRENGAPYKSGENFTVVIDGFLVSPNILIKKVYGHELNFENSDHNPVTGIFELK